MLPLSIVIPNVPDCLLIKRDDGSFKLVKVERFISMVVTEAKDGAS